MFLIQILLPLHDGSRNPFPPADFKLVAAELTDRFGGLTAYARSPASGFWEGEGGHTERDDIVVHEVMTESVDAAWWRDYRRVLEARFAQDEVVIRALGIQRL